TARGQEPTTAPPGTSIEQPAVLSDRAIERLPFDAAVPMGNLLVDFFSPPLRWPIDSPLGYTGPSGIAPREDQTNSHFVPMEDRWRIGFPTWDRYDRGHPRGEDYPYDL